MQVGFFGGYGGEPPIYIGPAFLPVLLSDGGAGEDEKKKTRQRAGHPNGGRTGGGAPLTTPGAPKAENNPTLDVRRRRTTFSREARKLVKVSLVIVARLGYFEKRRMTF